MIKSVPVVPLLAGALANVKTVPVTNVFVQFEVWNETTHAFETVPAGVPIDLVDFDPVSDDVLDTVNTDAQGRVHFVEVDIDSKAGGEKPDLFFVARTKGLNISGHTMPDEWSTKGWKDKNGKPGYYEDFTGQTLGDAGAPLVFRIGLDFHAVVKYVDKSVSSGNTAVNAISPKTVPVEFHSASPPGSDPAKKKMRTDAKGEVHGVVFDVSPGDTFYFHIEFEVEDPAIKLPRGLVHMPQFGWSTFWDEADKKSFPKDVTSIGTQTTPEVLACTINDRNVALYFLKHLYELSTFLFHITDGAWTGVKDLTLFRTAISGQDQAYSWPVGECNIGSKHHWNRGTLIHEMSHQVMWKEAGISSLGIAYQASPCGGLNLVHYSTLLSNPLHALIEGWAEFIEGIFDGSTPYTVTDVCDQKGNTIGPLSPPINRGESVEGAFANGLWEVFESYVRGTGNAHVPESVNGDVTATAAWIQNADVKNRFKAIIWAPLQDLKPRSNPKTVDFIGKMKSMHPGQWHTLVKHLHKYNMAFAAPTLASVSPASGLPAGGPTVTLTGTEFVDGQTTVTVGGNAATNVAVTSGATLTCKIPPGAAGKVPVVVTTPAGSATLAGGYEYASPPSISIVSPASGPALGGTKITVTGTNFRPNDQVFIGGVAATSVTFVSPTKLTAITPPMPIPFTQGAVDLEVRNPDGLKNIVTGGYIYEP